MVAGCAVDAAGAPVSGAEVYASGEGPLEIRTRTDAEGRFLLDGLWEGLAWVVAVSSDAVGATKVSVGDDDVVLAMRALKPGAELGPPVPIGPLTDFATDRRVAAELLEEGLRRFPPPHEGGIAGLEMAYAMLYPERMLELLEQENLWFGLGLAPALSQHGFEVLSRYLETIPEDAWRYRAAVAGLPFMRGENAGKLAVAALDYARKAGRSGRVLQAAARIAELLWEVDRPAAEELLRRVQQSVQAREPTDSMNAYALAHGAEALCILDLPWTLEMLEGLDIYSPGAQARLRIAGRIAANHPTVACRLVDEADELQRSRVWSGGNWIPDGRMADCDIMRIAYTMAPADPDRALALARGVKSSVLRARALAYIALALAPEDPQRASAIFDEVLMPVLTALAAGRAGMDSPASHPEVLCDLAGVAYRIGYPEPERVTWLAVASRTSRNQTELLRHLAFADPTLAAEMIPDAMEQAGLSATPLSEDAVQNLVLAAAAVDANLAAEILRRRDATSPSGGSEATERALWIRVVELLATPPEDRQSTTLYRHYLDWRPWVMGVE